MKKIQKSHQLIVAEHAIELLSKGNYAPSLQELFSVLDEQSRPIISKVARFLHGVRRHIERHYDLNVISIATFLYEDHRDPIGKVIRRSYRDQLPIPGQEGEAYKCLAMGGSSPIAGLYFPQDDHDIILLEYVKRGSKDGEHRKLLAGLRSAVGIQNGNLEERRTSKALSQANAEANMEKMGRILAALEDNKTLNSRVASLEQQLNTKVEDTQKMVLKMYKTLCRGKKKANV